jgi:hypothetical protein
VQTFCNLYGKEQLVYIIHSLIHVAGDVRRFGLLDNISSFEYESYLWQLKYSAQIVRRVSETNVCHSDGSGQFNVNDKDRFCKSHLEGLITVSLNRSRQYKQCSGKHCVVFVNHGEVVWRLRFV